MGQGTGGGGLHWDEPTGKRHLVELMERGAHTRAKGAARWAAWSVVCTRTRRELSTAGIAKIDCDYAHQLPHLLIKHGHTLPNSRSSKPTAQPLCCAPAQPSAAGGRAPPLFNGIENNENKAPALAQPWRLPPPFPPLAVNARAIALALLATGWQLAGGT
jgi:hypothetical protein